MSQQFANNYLAAARNLYKRLGKSFERQTQQCFLGRLDPDIILDDLIPYFDIENILNLRQVNRFFYMITHEPIIWKRFLESRMNVDVPQIRPSLDYAAQSSGFEIESLVVHAAQVATAWNCGNAIDLNSHRFLESQLEVVDIKMVPGGNFVIASVRDRSSLRFYLMVFVLDTKSGSRALARFHIPHKAFDLQAQYLDRNGHQGIMISYTTRKFTGHPSNYFNVSELSHKKVADSENISENLTYEAVCLHLSLEILEQLLQSPFDVPSPEYEAFLRSLDRPFRVAAKYTAARGFEITCSSLSMIENTPVLLLVVGGSMIVIINLSNGQVGAQFACNHSQFFPLAPHRIRALRHLPGQMDLLVIRSISIQPQKEEAHVFERYSIPRHSDAHNRNPESERELTELSTWEVVTEFSISDPGSYMKQTSDKHPKVFFREECPPTLWIFASLEAPYGLRYWRVRASKSELGQFRYDLPASKMYMNMSTHRARALPGSERVLVYNFETTTANSEMLVRLRRFSPAAVTFEKFPAPQPDMPAVTLLPEPFRAFREIESYQIKRRVNDNGGMSVITWDETTSRICMSTENEDVIHVYDIPRHYEPQRKLAFKWKQQAIAELELAMQRQ